jgi:hypothetical protein
VFSVSHCTKQWTHRVCFLWVTSPNNVSSTRVCFLRVTARFSCPGSNGPPSSLLFCLHICEHSSPVSLHNTTSTNEFLNWGWWWLPRSSTVEPARSRVQHQFSSFRQERGSCFEGKFLLFLSLKTQLCRWRSGGLLEMVWPRFLYLCCRAGSVSIGLIKKERPSPVLHPRFHHPQISRVLPVCH